MLRYLFALLSFASIGPHTATGDQVTRKLLGGVRGLVHKNRLRRDEENVKGKLLLSREPGPAVKEHDEGGDHRKDEGPEF